MEYHFDKVIDRRQSDSMKWSVDKMELPMWVADMDFQTAPEILEAMEERLRHGVFGYTVVPEKWYLAIMKWWWERHNFEIKKNWLVFCTGVVPAISSMVRKLSTVGENVLIQTPVYNVFFNSIINNGRRVLDSPLRYDGKSYTIDFKDLEKKLSDPQTTMMILCNPHNPIGKIWDKETLEKIGELCWKYHVTVIADEIHCDLTMPGSDYVPFASVSQKCMQISVTCIAPTKAFNLAALQTAAVVVPDSNLRHRVSRGLNTDEVAEPSGFAVEAAVVAFTKGGPWLDALREYIDGNRQRANTFVKNEIPQIKILPSQATYLLWIDCHRITENDEELACFIRQNTGLYLSAGSQYGQQGACFLRMNIACPRLLLEDGLCRLKHSVRDYLQTK